MSASRRWPGLHNIGCGKSTTWKGRIPRPHLHLCHAHTIPQSNMKLRAHLLWVSVLLLSPAAQAAVLAIDYGAEFTKLSLVKPGVPFDVVLDRDSKRKISSVVGWKRDDRVFGAEGKMSVSQTAYLASLMLNYSRQPGFQIHISRT
jgi:hypothetical protein